MHQLITTEMFLPEPGALRRFVQQAVDHWPRLLVIHFTLHSGTENIPKQQINAFYEAVYHRIHDHTIPRCNVGQPSPPVLLRWLWEKQGGAAVRCLLMMNQNLFCHACYERRSGEGYAQLADLLRSAWGTVCGEGQCETDSCFQVERTVTPAGDCRYEELKMVALSFILPVVAGITR
ncbi:inovirus-type Gp2 protein [Salmonella enterica]|uniref:Inovirus-type Gp2 protein n=1 Tax=Salmonella enterica TaxID=28901 RepID=A0A763UPD5_SALER|nr:inovirus-type Gp2 protein [Salmonella enterica]EDA1463683.1 inovirus Gp2 family protein [Salmonella enterica subsp. enterica serovar Chester]EEH0841581.1 inovirus Gp2 family protein [Salmonella enterica subsp. enterica serovar Poona]EEM9669633.1 inovirus Gp2 family protein [Salmonella enterica subsp. enterica serovar Poona]EHB4045003.1 inovirus-type Gp2 protein [Salmonella enterica]EHJ6422770.1 inovirus-type Gp2 protein [Salmonella enterica subsp. enterica serovar Chester]